MFTRAIGPNPYCHCAVLHPPHVPLRHPMPGLLPAASGSKRPSTADVSLPKKKRKQRKTFACAGESRPWVTAEIECRRLKMKCDRQGVSPPDKTDGSAVRTLRAAPVRRAVSGRRADRRPPAVRPCAVGLTPGCPKRPIATGTREGVKTTTAHWALSLPCALRHRLSAHHLLPLCSPPCPRRPPASCLTFLHPPRPISPSSTPRRGGVLGLASASRPPMTMPALGRC